MTQRTELARREVFASLKARSNWLVEGAPPSLDRDNWLAGLLNAIHHNPDLLQCTKGSLLMAAREAAGYGFSVFGKFAGAYLVPIKIKMGQSHVLEAQLWPSYKGMLELCMRSGKLSGPVQTGVVYAGDQFAYQLGSDPKIEHVPATNLPKKRQVTHVYLIMRFKDGGVLHEVWTKQQIEAHKEQYSRAWKAKDSIWQTNWEAAAKKTLIRSVVQSGRVPISMVDRDLIIREAPAVIDDGPAEEWGTPETHTVAETELPAADTRSPAEMDEPPPIEPDETAAVQKQQFDDAGLPK